MISCDSVSNETNVQMLKEFLQKSFIAPQLSENEPYMGEGKVLLRDKKGNAVHIDYNGNIIKTLKDSIAVHKYICQLNYPQGLYPIKKDSKWGFVNNNDSLVIPYIYDKVVSFKRRNLHWVKKNEDWGCINNEGREIIPLGIYRFEKANDSFYVISCSYGNGAVSQDGELIVPSVYEGVYDYNGYIKVSRKVGNRLTYGLYDYSGKMLFDCEYDDINCDTYGMYVWIQTKKENWCQYHYGVQGRWGDVEFSSSRIYTRGEPFKGGYARVFSGEQYGFLSLLEQREIIPCIYNHSFEHYGYGVFVLWNDGYFAFVDEEKNLLTPYKYKDAHVFENYISVKDVKTSKWGLLDYKGNEIIPPLYDAAFTISPNKLVSVRKNGKEGCIDKNNNEIIPFEYDCIEIEKSSFIKATQNNSVKIYNNKGELTQYEDMQIISFYGLYITCLTNDEEMMVNVKRKYDLNDAFSNVIIKTDNKVEVQKQLIKLCSQIAKYLLGEKADVDLTQMILGQENVKLFLYNDNAFKY